ncbi:MAG: YjcZ family sporulation protein [Bacillales bacterium]|nr:YjcZ family sporulation protein [Bacillales bacterium]
MFYGQNYGYPQGGYAYPMNNGGSWGGVFAIVLVLFILLVIIGCGCGNNQTCQGGF